MQEHLVSPYALPAVHRVVPLAERQGAPAVPQLGPVREPAMDMPTALAYSCDTYFYQLGNAFFELPQDRGHPLQDWATHFGFGQRTGVDVGPRGGGARADDRRGASGSSRRSPTRAAGRSTSSGSRATRSSSRSARSDLLVTPLQMARFYALIANGGKLVTPHLLIDVENPNATRSCRRRRCRPRAGRRSIPPPSRSCAGPLRGDAPDRSARRTGVFGSSRSRSRARRAPPRRS